MTLSSNQYSWFSRAVHRLRFKLWGRRAGLGQPVPASALDHEYASGAWDHFFGPEELPRHEVMVELIRKSSVHPALLDLGCGSGRLAQMVQSLELKNYLGVDISTAGLERARSLHLPYGQFERADFESWTPEPGIFDVITFNECLGYAPDPLCTAERFARQLPPGGALIVSHFQSTNYREFWRRLALRFEVVESRTATTSSGKIWDLRVLRLRA